MAGSVPAGQNGPVPTVPFTPAWGESDCDTARLWADSGAQGLTVPGVGVPERLVRSVVGLVRWLDTGGAGLAAVSGAEGLGLLTGRAALMGRRCEHGANVTGSTRLLAARDGWLAVALPRSADIDLLPAWLGVDPVSDSVPWEAVSSAVARRDRWSTVETAALLGLACAGVGETADRRPVLLEHLGTATARPLSGSIVVNLASLWAGPLAAHVLHRLGARVITVESSTRPDGARSQPAFFEALHTGTESVLLPLHTDEGWERLADLVSGADVVIEGSRPRALAQRGVLARSLVAQGPQVWVSLTAHGRTSPHDRRVGFGDDAAAAGGLVGWSDRGPEFLVDAVADPLTGLTAAATVVQLLAAGGRWLADVALARVAASAARRPGDPVVAAPVTKDASPPVRLAERA